MAMIISSSQMGMKPVKISSGKKKVKEAHRYNNNSSNGKNNTSISNRTTHTYDDHGDDGTHIYTKKNTFS